MRRARVSFLAVCGLILAAGLIFAQVKTLKVGSRGYEVFRLQGNLARLGFFDDVPTGYFGAVTEQSVKDFQRSVDLKPDGVAGELTQTALDRAVTELSAEMASRSGGVAVTLLSWDIVNQLWPRKTTARIYDVETGISLVMWRLYGSLHADVEPLTKYDTYQLKRMYGNWSWDRRAIIVELGGRYIAASMNGMPHGYYEIKDNDFPGQVCIHFLGSRLHKNRQVDRTHQETVLRAAQTGLPGLIRPAGDSSLEESPEMREAIETASENSPEIE